MNNSTREWSQAQVRNDQDREEDPKTPSPTQATISTPPKSIEGSPQGTGEILCTHDGVLLKKISAEHMSNLNTSGALSVVEYTFASPMRRREIYIEWRPNNINIIADDTQDQGDWSLVDTISRRTRTTSECKAFNMSMPAPGSAARTVRANLQDLATIEVKNRGQTLRFTRKSDRALFSEFFFQHGNAEQFMSSMRQLHIIDIQPGVHSGEEYVILNTDTQRLKKTFATLDIGEIKASSNVNEGWLPNKLVGFLVSFPDMMQANRNAPPKARPGAVVEKSSPSSGNADNYQVIAMSNSASSGSPSRGSSVDKSPLDSELENVKEEDEKIVNTLPERQAVERGSPLNETQWLECKTFDGRTYDPTHIREIVFRGGIAHSLRPEVWKYLLNYSIWSDSAVERIDRRKQKSMEYYSMKAQWLSMTTKQENNFNGYRERKCQIEKDVKRTDRSLDFFAGEDNPNLELLQGILMTYVMYNFDLGYVQGMSDLLAPILAMQQNEVDAFWCFVGFMEMLCTNFDIDQAGMKVQFEQLRNLLEFANPRLFNYIVSHESDNMYFCFRWLLVWYKREFDNDDVLKLWECLWTRLPCPNFHLLISVALLDQQTDIIIESKYEFTEILRHVNDLAGNIDVKRVLETAEAIYLQIKAADNLPNKIRQIIGEPLLEVPPDDASSAAAQQEDLDDSFDDLTPEQTPEEKQRQQELLEEACERSMYMHYV